MRYAEKFNDSDQTETEDSTEDNYSETSRTKTSQEEEKVDIEDLRAKNKKAQDDMKEERNKILKIQIHLPMVVQIKLIYLKNFKIIFIFFTKSGKVNKMIGQVSDSVDGMVEKFHPSNLMYNRKPIKIQKYYASANLTAVYVEMLKCLSLKTKQAIDVKMESENFDIITEATTFNSS